MRILQNPNFSDIFFYDVQKEVLRVHFLLNQVDIIDKESLLYGRLNIHDSSPIQISMEESVKSRTLKLVESLKVTHHLKIYLNNKNNRYFLIQSDEQFIEIDRDLKGIADKTNTLFWQSHYNLKKPMRNLFENEIKFYYGIVGKIEGILK